MSTQAEQLRQAAKFARIPPFALNTTLAALGQPALRSAITDEVYLERGGLKSLVLRHDNYQGFATYTAGFSAQRVFARFALDIAMVSGVEMVTYAPVGTMTFELRNHQPGEDPLNPILQRRGQGFIAIPDMYEGLPLGQRSMGKEIAGFLADHLSQGGGLLVLQPAMMSAEVDYSSYTVEPLTSILASFQQLIIVNQTP